MRNQINIDKICVLRKNPKSRLVYLDYINIEKPLEKQVKEILQLINTNGNTLSHLLKLILDNKSLSLLLNKFDYCQNLSGAYQGINLELNDIKNKYNISISNSREKYLKNELRKDIAERVNAYYLSLAYIVCEKMMEKDEIIAYSHRKTGWSTPNYKINKVFSVEIKTNFGYGSVSYFYTKLRYKEINILPYSEWVLYRNANLYEIIRYSSKHRLHNDSWIEAFEYACSACNLATTNEIEFVNKYIIEECEKMVSGIELFLIGNRFKFINQNSEKIIEELSGYKLTEFRCEKIAGALDFIDSILEYDGILDVRKFTTRIESCCLKLKNILPGELRLIGIKLNNMKKEIKEIEPEYKEMNAIFNQYVEEICEATSSNNKTLWLKRISLMFQKLEDEYRKKNSEYNKFKIKHDIIESKYKNLKMNIYSLETTKEKILKYKHKIKTYFEKFNE